MDVVQDAAADIVSGADESVLPALAWRNLTSLLSNVTASELDAGKVGLPVANQTCRPTNNANVLPD